MVIDLYGLEAEEVRRLHPRIYQWVLERVKPERDSNADRELRERWWLFRRTNIVMRQATSGLTRYVATPETAKHRTFQFVPGGVLPDNMVIAIGTDSAEHLGALSSRVHVTWALATGGTLEDRPRYNKTRCFETFPFPAERPERIGTLAEEIDAHRKRQQEAHDDVTLTGMYNVLEKLRAGEELTAKDRVVHEHGLVSVLKELHDELDLAVLEAYGWSDLAPLMDVANGNRAPATVGAGSREEAVRALDETLLERLVALNAERAAEEARGLIRWLRPEFQAKGTVATEATSKQGALDLEIDGGAEEVEVDKRPWPTGVPEQILAVNAVLTASPVPLPPEAIAAHFKARGAWKSRLGTLLETLVALGHVERRGAVYTARR
jgi:hypothetical protein